MAITNNSAELDSTKSRISDSECSERSSLGSEHESQQTRVLNSERESQQTCVTNKERELQKARVSTHMATSQATDARHLTPVSKHRKRPQGRTVTNTRTQLNGCVGPKVRI